MYEQFKAIGNTAWTVDDAGVTLGRELYRWVEIEDPVDDSPSVRASRINVGCFRIRARRKKLRLAYTYEDAGRAHDAMSFVRCQVSAAHEAIASGNSAIVGATARTQPHQTSGDSIWERVGQLAVTNLSPGNSLARNMATKLATKALGVADEMLSADERLLAVIVGSSGGEYLLCSDSMVYIVKKGYATRGSLGKNVFRAPYASITNVSVESKIMTGYLVVSTAGVDNRKMDFWAPRGRVSSPQSAPNTITIGDSSKRGKYDEVATFIMRKVQETHAGSHGEVTIQKEPSAAEQIRQFKELLDDGIITEEEFAEKKKQLLAL